MVLAGVEFFPFSSSYSAMLSISSWNSTDIARMFCLCSYAKKTLSTPPRVAGWGASKRLGWDIARTASLN